MNDEPSVKEMAALWNVCYNFIKTQRIHTEAVCEDRVYENAPNLIEDIAEIIGYFEYPEDE
jgi:hypothetical protein